MTVAPHCPGVLDATIGVGQFINGNCVSFTLTIKEQLALLPAASVAIAFTVVCPTGKKLPETGVAVAVAPQLSVAVTLKVTIAPHCPCVLFCKMGEFGQLMTGD